MSIKIQSIQSIFFKMGLFHEMNSFTCDSCLRGTNIYRVTDSVAIAELFSV